MPKTIAPAKGRSVYSRPAVGAPGALRVTANATTLGELSVVEWVHRARCKDVDPELFFPIGTTGPAAVQIDAAKAICELCEVRGECLEWAMITGQDAGVWGGLSEEERRALRRARRRQAAQMAAAG